MRAAIRLRYDLSPYIYDAARQGYDSGICMCRPLYYDYPETAEAYDWKEEFMFGDNILATVLCQPADKTTGLTERTMWFPEGNDWYDMATGKTYKGGTTATLYYTMEENPWFVKCGSIIPMAASDIESLQQQSNEIRILVAPGREHSVYTHYEDDGATQAYANEYATTRIEKSTANGSTVVSVAPRQGGYKDMDPMRKVSIMLECVLPPTEITVNGTAVQYSRHPAQSAGKACWSYDGNSLTATVYLPEMPATEQITLVYSASESNAKLLDGKKGLIRRMMAITPETKIVYADNIDPYPLLPKPFMAVAGAGSAITEAPQSAVSHLVNIDVDEMVEVICGNDKLPADYKEKIKSQIKF